MRDKYKRVIMATVIMSCMSTVSFAEVASVDYQQGITQAEQITVQTEGRAVGIRKYHEIVEYPNGLHIQVRGVGYDTALKKHHNVSGIYVHDGTRLTVHKGLTVTMQNPIPYDQADEMAHYYMSGIYAGFGRKHVDDPKYDTKVVVHGPTVIQAVGNGVQANKDSYITLDGPVKIETVPFERADVYAAIVEEGSIGIGTSQLADIYTGTALVSTPKPSQYATVQVTGNVGVLNKNYGLNPNPGRHGSYIVMNLGTKDSVWTGAALNEFAESGDNPHHSGITLELKNQATWHNRWMGAKRHRSGHEELLLATGKGYTFTGSHIQTLIGGDTPETAGIIYQEDTEPIVVDVLQGHVKIVDRRPNATDTTAPIRVITNAGQLTILK
ncbi:hypothetical protein [Veillonella sp. VA139]|uniref:hypothetical protein n=1 Tax=Veillonella sp. VA139 TaxID=741830 RepID=UPI0013DF437A|nr:hypothetical protein [Veillonella sp. VA139]